MNQSNASPRPTPITLATYRDLRVGMVVIMVMLAVAVLIERFYFAKHWQLAISAYYYTSAHSIVTGALLALGALFIIYRGSSDTEDALLTLAGVSALTAAMVPQGRPAPLYGSDQLPIDFVPAAQPNVWAVVIALVVGWVLMLVQHLRAHTWPKTSPIGTVVRLFFWLIMAVGLITLIFFPALFMANAHGAGGLLMLSSFILTVFCAAYVVGQEQQEKPKHWRFYRGFYRFMAVVMLVTLILIVTFHVKFPNWELWTLLIEAALILEFAAYWLVQTIELWHTPDRRKHLSDDTQKRLEEWHTKGGLAGLTALSNVKDEPGDGKLLPYL